MYVFNIRSHITKRNLVSTGLLILGIAQALQYKHFKMDWPAFSLILCGAVSLLFKIEDIGSLVESLEFGKTKVLFRKTEALNLSVEEAIESQGVQGSNTGPLSASVEKVSAVKTSGDPVQKASEAVLGTLSRDKDAALIMLSIEIEIALSTLCRRAGISVPKAGIIWSKSINDLVAQGTLSPETGKALREFRDVRNSIIHASSSTKPVELSIASALDSGLKLLRILEQIEAA